MAKKQYDHAFRLMLIGDSGVGKTRIWHSFCDDCDHSNPKSSVGVDIKQKIITMDELEIFLQIFDTPGQERFAEHSKSHYVKANGVMVVYDITNASTFESVRKWLEELDNYAKKDPARMIVGNKSDLEAQRAVSTEAGQKLAKQRGTAFCEVSVKDNVNVNKAFDDLVRVVLKNRRASLSTKNSCLRCCGKWCP